MTGSGIRRTGTTSSPWLGDSSRNRANQTSTRTPGPGVSNLTAPYTGDSGCPCLPPLVAVGPGIPPFFPHILVWGSSFLCLIPLLPLLPLLRSSHTPLISHTTHLTPLILHYSSHTTHHTPLHLTPLITHTTHHTHHSSHTPLITHHSSHTTPSHTTHHTHHSSHTTPSHTTHHSHHSSHTTHHTPLI